MGIEIGQRALALGDRIEFLRSLGNWLNSGGGHMSTAEAVRFTCETFGRDEYKAFRPRMEHIIREVQSGQTPLYRALADAQLGFERQSLSILEAGEKSNQLRKAIPDLVHALEVRANARKSLMLKLSMPLIGGVMLVFMSIGVLTIMMPQVLEPVLRRNADALADMPFIIGWFWEVSKWLREYWMMPVAVVVSLILILLFRNTPVIKPHFEKVVMSFGPLRRLSLAYNAVLVVYFMPALVRSGMPFYDILRSMANSIDNLGIAATLRIAAHDHEAGMRLLDALESIPFRSSFRGAIEAGEKTGQIAERIEDLKAPYNGDLERIIRQVVAATIIMVMAILLPFFLISMYITLTVPIFALMEY